MIVYGVKFKSQGSPTCIWPTSAKACREVFDILKEADVGDEILITVKNISEEKFRNMKEFNGY